MYGDPIETVVNFQFGTEILDTPPWHEIYTKRSFIPPVRKAVQRNKKFLHCLSLPVIAVSNLRSLFPKINNFKTDVQERGIHLSLLSEVWESTVNKKHKSMVE